VRDLQHPLIEPDVRFSRIRLSEHLHREAETPEPVVGDVASYDSRCS
jgi:hypothetical protein